MRDCLVLMTHLIVTIIKILAPGGARATDWKDGKPETELNFKFYRQATNKIVGLSDETAAFLSGFF
jgi:hypothetical protein